MRLFWLVFTILFVVGILPLLAVLGFSLAGIDPLVRESAGQSLATVVSQAASEISRRVESAYNTVELLAADPLVRSPAATRDDREATLRGAMVLNADFRDITLLDLDGRVIASVNYSLIGDWASTSWFQSAVQGETVVSDVHSVLYPFEIVYTLAHPVRTPDGVIYGALSSQITVRDISQIVASAEVGLGGEFYVIDHRGLIIASHDPEDALEHIHFAALTTPSRLSFGEVFEISDGATKYVVSAMPVVAGDTGAAATWFVVGIQPVADAYAVFFRWRLALSLAFAGSIMLVLATSYFFARGRSRQFRGIASAARSIGMGQFSVRLPEGKVIEIRDLSAALNSAAEKLEEAWEARWDAENELMAARDDLELKVRERTADLERQIEVRKEAEVAALLEKRNAERASKAKSDFLANMSHELRTPLNHIIGFVQLVTDSRVGDLNETQREYLDDALGSSKHLLSLINEVLDLSKAESGKMSLARSNFDPAAMIESCVRSSEGQAKIKKITLTTELDGLPDRVFADEKKLTQVMLNLISNAVKFTSSGGTVTVSAEVVPVPSSDGSQCCISVTDTGIGIRSEDLQRVFRPFEQVTSDEVNAVAGTGLGLALSQRLVELHSGTIRAESDGRGQGSTFSVRIPIADEPD